MISFSGLSAVEQEFPRRRLMLYSFLFRAAAKLKLERYEITVAKINHDKSSSLLVPLEGDQALALLPLGEVVREATGPQSHQCSSHGGFECHN